MTRSIRVQVVYALPLEQAVVDVAVEEGAAVNRAVEQSGLAERYADIRPGESAVGIWGRPVDWSAVLRDGDRVELYRPLVADPKEVRRQRAKPRR